MDTSSLFCLSIYEKSLPSEVDVDAHLPQSPPPPYDATEYMVSPRSKVTTLQMKQSTLDIQTVVDEIYARLKNLESTSQLLVQSLKQTEELLMFHRHSAFQNDQFLGQINHSLEQLIDEAQRSLTWPMNRRPVKKSHASSNKSQPKHQRRGQFPKTECSKETSGSECIVALETKKSKLAHLQLKNAKKSLSVLNSHDPYSNYQHDRLSEIQPTPPPRSLWQFIHSLPSPFTFVAEKKNSNSISTCFTKQSVFYAALLIIRISHDMQHGGNHWRTDTGIRQTARVFQLVERQDQRRLNLWLRQASLLVYVARLRRNLLVFSYRIAVR